MQIGSAFKKILFLTDGSPPSLLAQEFTIELAKKLGAEVTVFHVVTHELMRPIVQDFVVQGRAIPESADIKPAAEVRQEVSMGRESPTSSGAHYGERIEDELTQVYRQEGEDIVADSAQVFKEEGVQVQQKVVEHKNIVDAVMEEVEREDYGLIAMGRSGRKEKESRLGAVAEKISRHAEIPVLIAGEKRTISRMLVPLDGSKSSEKALMYAAALAGKVHAKVTLLYVQESRLFGLRPELSKTIGTGVLTDAAAKVKEAEFDQRLESGDPARKITELAEKEDFDMIVMGSRGHNALGRILLGSVSNHVLHYTKRTVLIVK